MVWRLPEVRFVSWRLCVLVADDCAGWWPAAA